MDNIGNRSHAGNILLVHAPPFRAVPSLQPCYSNFPTLNSSGVATLDCLLSHQFVKGCLWGLFIHIKALRCIATRMVARQAQKFTNIYIMFAAYRAKKADHARNDPCW